MYRENPKTKGSGILCAIPQKGTCHNNCKDCFFQSGRSYLEPLSDNLPNIPSAELARNHIIRVNDGNDSLYDIDTVIRETKDFPFKFYNTSHTNGIKDLPGPVVVTINPDRLTDTMFYQIDKLDMPDNLMFVRFRTNMWNLRLLSSAIDDYTGIRPIILTFMAYHDIESIPKEYRSYYIYRQRTINPYYAITTEGWHEIMDIYKDNIWVYSCGRLEGEMGDTHCRFCGNCIREYFVTMERMHPFIEK